MNGIFEYLKDYNVNQTAKRLTKLPKVEAPKEA